MGIDGMRRKEKLFGNLHVGIPFGNQGDNLQLALADIDRFTVEFGELQIIHINRLFSNGIENLSAEKTSACCGLPHTVDNFMHVTILLDIADNSGAQGIHNRYSRLLAGDGHKAHLLVLFVNGRNNINTKMLRCEIYQDYIGLKPFYHVAQLLLR